MHKEEVVWPDGTHPMSYGEWIIIWMTHFKSVAPLLYSGKSTIFGIFIWKRVWPYKYADDIPQVTLFLNIIVLLI